MASVSEALAVLEAAQGSGELARFCEQQHIALLVLHGSAVTRPDTAGDIDLAYLPVFGTDVDHLEVVLAFLKLLPTDLVDLMPLHRADPVATYAALGRGEKLYEREPHLFAEQQIRAFGVYADTQWLRDLAWEEAR